MLVVVQDLCSEAETVDQCFDTTLVAHQTDVECVEGERLYVDEFKPMAHGQLCHGVNGKVP